MIPYKCPVCEGRGSVPGGFYLGSGPYSTADTSTEVCKTCQGTGVIWGSDSIRFPKEDSLKIKKYDHEDDFSLEEYT